MATLTEQQPNLPMQPEDLFDSHSPTMRASSSIPSPQSVSTPLGLGPPFPLNAVVKPLTPGSTPRRPPRKSTLTQQQKNQKRQRATQDQLTTLEVEFNKNPTPTAVVRERIAQEINMTERSVQIWFQNRRAKIKNLAKKSIETGEDCDAIPESMRRYLAIQAAESGKPLSSDALANAGIQALGNGLIMNADSSSKVLISHLACRSLSIGSWRRISQTALDLVVFYSPAKSMFTYYIHADSSGFKIEYPFSHIKNITLDAGDPSEGAEGSTQRTGGLVVELTQPPTFSMDPGTGGFFQCRDFTEDQQASQVLVHHLGGHPKVLATQLAKLVSLEPFRNRHQNNGPTNNMPVSAPVSPTEIQRPASQPSFVPQTAEPAGVHPHSVIMGPPPSRLGHKRQRSRSVPAAIDLSQFRRPMPPFLQQELSHSSQPLQTGDIFAPIPQHPMMPVSAPMNDLNAVGSTLTINTTAASYDFDFRGPLTATTVNSVDLDPSYFNLAAPSDTYTSSALHTPYASTFLSPAIGGPAGDSPFAIGAPGSAVAVSPFSTYSTGDPVIANTSPPLGAYDHDRSSSADVYHAGPPSVFQDESLSCGNEYLKPPFSLPFRSPVADHAVPVSLTVSHGHGNGHTHPVEDFVDFHSMVEFHPPSTESASLSPDMAQYVSTT